MRCAPWSISTEVEPDGYTNIRRGLPVAVSMKTTVLSLGRGLMSTLVLMLSFGPLAAQTALDWQMLAKVAFVPEQDPLGGYPITRPVFDEEVRALAGETVSIQGYMLPVDTEGRQYVLSAFPYASCFFCGGAGRESVMALELLPGHRRFQPDEYLRLVGKLALSEEEYDLIYRLEAAKAVE